ncbi:hypothetical protein EGW08_019434, partial [Elysia chlorotica]
DGSWSNLIGSIERFVSVYTHEWSDCFDICLLPLRNTVSQMTEFTPSFLLMGREPSFPGAIMPTKQSVNVEMSLSSEQIHHAYDAAMSMYHRCCLPDVKHIIKSTAVITSLGSEKSSSSIRNTAVVDAIQKSGRKTKKSVQHDEKKGEESRSFENGNEISRSEGHD